MTTTFCFINQKGGCGKSSICFHLAGCFAERGFEVLLVDADPQGSLSQGFFGSSAVESLRSTETLAALFEETCCWDTPNALCIPTSFERIHLVPANQTLARHNTPSPELAGLKQQALRSFLGQIRRFNMVLIDCPPNLYQCTWNAMLAADFAVVPVPPEDFGTQGLRVVHQAVENARRLNPALRLLGHVVTRYDGRLLVHQAYDKKLRALYPDCMVRTVIPEASAFKVALVCRQPVGHYSPRCKAARMTRALADEMINKAVQSPAKRQVA